VDLSRRSTEPELLDEGVSAEEARKSLADLRFVNRWLGGRRALVGVVAPLLADAPRPRLLDVGCGSADLPDCVSRVVPEVLAVGVDIKPVHLREAPPSVRPVVADVRRLPFPPRSFDVVTASLFLHHFDEPEVADVLSALFGLARRALVVNDLRRAQVPYWFGRLVFPLMFRSRVSMLDGLVSIRRSFTKAELTTAFARAGIASVRIRRSFPYRLVAVALRNA
jgi:SAM-dependent methyltransferase